MRTITVFTKPAGAAVFIDGRYMGSTTTLANVGGYQDHGKVTVEAPGGEFDLFVWRAGNYPKRHHVSTAVGDLSIVFTLDTNVSMPAPPVLRVGQCAPAPDPMWPYYPELDPWSPACHDVAIPNDPPTPLPSPPQPPPEVARARPGAGRMAALIGVAALAVTGVWWFQRG